jgi:hypothetical protein
MPLTSQAEILSHNLIGKAADIRLTNNYQENAGTGDIQVQLCPDCTNRTLVMSAESKVMKSDHALQLNQLKTYLNADRNAPMRLQFHKDTKQVIYINLNTPNKEMPQ